MSAAQAVERIRYVRTRFKVALENAAITDKLLELIIQYDVKGKQMPGGDDPLLRQRIVQTSKLGRDA